MRTEGTDDNAGACQPQLHGAGWDSEVGWNAGMLATYLAGKQVPVDKKALGVMQRGGDANN